MPEADPGLERTSATPRSWRAIPEWLLVVGVGAFAALVFTIPFLNNPYFYYVGDNPESFVPNWHHFGELVRAGQWPLLDAAGWYSANYPGEAAYSVWNPVAMLNAVVVSLFDDLAAAAALVMIEYLALLAMGVYLLAREYGASRMAAVVVAIAVPAAGFTLYYEAAGWPAGLAAFLWVTWFWWGARRFSRRQASPLLPFALGLLAMTTGNPYAVLGILIVLFGIAVELVLRRELRVLAHLTLTAACVGASSLVVFLPLLLSLPVTARQQLATIANDTFLVPDLGDLAAASSPTYLPSILNWNGALRETLPSTYFMWFAVPLLPWLRWRSWRAAARPIASLVTVVVCFSILVLGPSNVWLFRWPIRLIEYLYLGLGVLFALVLSAGVARDHVRERSLATAGLVAAAAYLSYAVHPELYRMHIASGLVVLALTLGAVALYRRGSWLGFTAVLLIGTTAVLAYQTDRLPPRAPDAQPTGPARYVSEVEAAAASYRGTVLQLAVQREVRSDDDQSRVLFGNLMLLTGHESITGYSGIGFAEFAEQLCVDYKGVVCPTTYERLWQPYPGTQTPLVDVLRVQTLVVQHRLHPVQSFGPPPAGWSVAARDELRTVWVRDEPLPYPGRVASASRGVEVLAADAGPRHERVSYQASEAGTLVFARLAWPGYAASIDGRPVTIEDGPAGLVTVAVPAGAHSLELTYQTPGLRLGAWLLVVATAIVLAQAVLWWWGSRRRRRQPEPPAPGPQDQEVEKATATPVPVHAGPQT